MQKKLQPYIQATAGIPAIQLVFQDAGRITLLRSRDRCDRPRRFLEVSILLNTLF
jgi:hypothetical protein